MAEPKAVLREQRIVAVALPRPYSLNGEASAHFASTKGKYLVTRDERGDVTVVHVGSGRSLFIPKQLAVLELADG